ncbi:hypothetical protein [Aquimarina aggregata]|uniref:hypothetical protein n=2 Tax=Aquimarina aggregata TaxID=1642818 RepID=UPI0024936E07|nr:hypothetical protein [Aquimarina aggregata]
MKHMKTYLMITISSLLALFSCVEKQACSDGVNGTLIEMSVLDGCSWIIQLDAGEKLQPVNLNNFEIEKKNELKVSMVYKEVEAMAGICMVGKMVEISCLKVMN